MASDHPAISVLIPVCNVERYVGECLDSLLGQTFGDFEAICLNDGSTDRSSEILHEYARKDPRFRVIDKENSGYGSTMNRGLAEARGSYIAILESDDFFEPTSLERLYRAAVELDVQVVKADFWFYWSIPEKRRKAFGFARPELEGKVVRPLDELDFFYKKPSIWSALYRRDFLQTNDIRFLETPGASYQDAAFNFKVWACATRVTYLADPVINYRQDNEKSSVNSPNKVFCVCDEYAEMERFLASRPDLPSELEGIKSRMKFDTYMWNRKRLSSELRQDFLDRASEEFRGDAKAGRIDWSLFEPWAEAQLRLLMKDSRTFEEMRLELSKPGKLSTILFYAKIGGLPLVWRVLRSSKGRGE